MARRRMRNHGLTVMELTFALVSLSFLGIAITSLLVAAGDAWQTRDTYVDQNQSMRALSVRLSQWVRESKRVIAAGQVGSRTEVLIWTNDDHFPGEVNLGELRLLSFDSAEGSLALYQVEINAAQLQDHGFNVPMEPTTLGDIAYAAEFRAREDVHQYPLSERIAAMTATSGQTHGDAPGSFVEIRVTFDLPQGHTDQTVLVAAGCRAPDNVIEFVPEG